MIPLRTAALIGSHLVLALTAGAGGWKIRDADYQRHLNKEARAVVINLGKVREQEALNETVSQAIREGLAAQQLKTRETTNTIIEKVPYYVTQTPAARSLDAAGGLPLGFVWSYNGAASGSAAPLPSGSDPGTPTGTGLSTLAEVGARNAELYRECNAERAGWRDWYNRLAPSFKSSAPGDKPAE